MNFSKVAFIFERSDERDEGRLSSFRGITSASGYLSSSMQFWSAPLSRSAIIFYSKLS